MNHWFTHLHRLSKCCTPHLRQIHGDLLQVSNEDLAFSLHVQEFKTLHILLLVWAMQKNVHVAQILCWLYLSIVVSVHNFKDPCQQETCRTHSQNTKKLHKVLFVQPIVKRLLVIPAHEKTLRFDNLHQLFTSKPPTRLLLILDHVLQTLLVFLTHALPTAKDVH